LKEIKLDEIDHQIIDLLREDGRYSFVYLAEKTGLSRVAVRERFNNLIEKGVIERITAVINSEKYGKRVSAFFQIEVEPSALVEIALKLAKHKDVASINHMTGYSSLHTQVYLDDNEAMRNFMQELYAMPGITMVKNQILLKCYKSRNDFVVR